MVEMDFDEINDNDFNILGNKLLNGKNMPRKAILSRPQSWQIALNKLTKEVLADPFYQCPHCGSVIEKCPSCGNKTHYFLYEGDVYDRMGDHLLDTSLSMNGEGFKTTAKVFAHHIEDAGRKKRDEPLEGDR